ncbi:hypothetical protein ACT7DH_03795 [Bacillus pacificus]
MEHQLEATSVIAGMLTLILGARLFLDVQKINDESSFGNEMYEKSENDVRFFVLS